MLAITCVQASRFENSLLNRDFQIQIKKQKYFIGRGEELLEKESQKCGIIDLTKFDNTLSRVHASINFSPAWFAKNLDQIPRYLTQLASQQQKLPPDVVQKIWEYLRPQKECLLKDLKSKVGIFTRIDFQQIESEMVIEFVHQSFIRFEYCEQYESFEEFEEKVRSYQVSQQDQTVVFGHLPKVRLHYDSLHSQKEKLETLRIWHFTIKQTKYILLIQQNLTLRIGRSSHCQIQIKDSAISRYQAYLKCQNRTWKVFDGNQIEKSKNGTWKREKVISIPVSRSEESLVRTDVKIGTIKCEVEVVENFSWLDVQKIVNGNVSKNFIEVGMSETEKDSSVIS